MTGTGRMPLALAGEGPASAPVATLSWALFAGGGLILLLVLVLLGVALWGPERWRRRWRGERAILGLGFVFPVIVLSALLVIGLSMTASLASSRRPADALDVRVIGERWWWRIQYDGFETANELVIPAGRPVHLELRSTNVLHSFWVPELGGKRDMIPGRANHLNLQADRPGLYHGICAEYCGGPHALMQFKVRALAPADYARWEGAQRLPARQADAAGQARFQALGCGSCHSVRGTAAIGVTGPDLTHLATRSTIAAGVLPMSRANLTRWTREANHLKPNNLMPGYPNLSVAEADALSTYMAGLR